MKWCEFKWSLVCLCILYFGLCCVWGSIPANWVGHLGWDVPERTPYIPLFTQMKTSLCLYCHVAYTPRLPQLSSRVPFEICWNSVTSMVMKKPFSSYKRIMQAISASLVQSGKVVTWEKGISGQLGHEDMVSNL